MERNNEYIADDRTANPEYFEWLKNMTEEEFAQHIENLKKQAEWDALDEKIMHPEKTVYCPRCGKEIKLRRAGNSCEAKCVTDGCIKETLRGL